MGNLTFCGAPIIGGAFDSVSCPHAGRLDQNFAQKSKAQGFAWVGWGGGGEELHNNVHLNWFFFFCCFVIAYKIVRNIVEKLTKTF